MRRNEKAHVGSASQSHLQPLTRRRFLGGSAVVVSATAGSGLMPVAPTMHIRLTRDYGYERYRASDLPLGAVIDAREATWIVQNSRSEPDTVGCDTGGGMINRYPFQAYRSPGVQAVGGTIHGKVPQGSEWRSTYKDMNSGASCNSAAVLFKHSPRAIAKGWRIDKCWDGLRFDHGCDGWLALRCHLTDVRDDAIGNIRRLSGTVKDCLLDGVFVGISLHNDQGVDGGNNELLVDGVLMRMQRYRYKKAITHGTPFKAQSDIDRMPALRLRNNVFAITMVNHLGRNRLQHAWDRTVESENNVFLNLADEPLPADYPASFGVLRRKWAGFTVLQEQDARTYWEQARLKWLGEP